MDQGSNQDNNQDTNNFIVLNDFLKNTVHHWQERKSQQIPGKEIEMKNVLEIEYSWNSNPSMQLMSKHEE